MKYEDTITLYCTHSCCKQTVPWMFAEGMMQNTKWNASSLWYPQYQNLFRLYFILFIHSFVWVGVWVAWLIYVVSIWKIFDYLIWLFLIWWMNIRGFTPPWPLLQQYQSTMEGPQTNSFIPVLQPQVFQSEHWLCCREQSSSLDSAH